MRSELFEEAWKQNRHVWESTKCLAQAMYLAGEQHQQSKVDELTQHIKRLESKLDSLGSDRQGLVGQVDELQLKLGEDNRILHNVIEIERKKNDELQKRVDAFKDQAVMLRDAAKSHVYTEGERHILLSQAADIERILCLEQALKGGSAPNLNTDENGECRHFSTTMFADSKAECFHCDAVVNEKREVIGKQSKGLSPFFTKTFSKEPK